MDTHITVKSILEIIPYTENYDAVLFDLDDTLYSETDSVRENIKNVTETYGCPELAEDIYEEFKNGWSYLTRFMEDRLDLSEEMKAAWIKTYSETKPTLTPYDGVLDMLTLLRTRGKKLGIITDGRVDGQNAKLDGLNIRGYFDHIIITNSLGTEARKPSTAAFLEIQRHLGIPFDRMMYVGDNPEKDIPPAIKLGMGSFHFDNDKGIYKLHKNK